VQRRIIHLDMDAFYAAIGQQDFPELHSKPLIVGGDRNRGVVATASYEARPYGIHSAMPMAQALKLFFAFFAQARRFSRPVKTAASETR
jgi:DNA polymerase-4